MGSSTSSDIILPFPGVSRRHARFEAHDDLLRLVDLGSKNRLIVGGERVDRVELDVGTTVQVGRAFLTLEDGPTSDIEVALRIVDTNTTRRQERSTADGDGDIRAQSAEAALRCIREIELASETMFQRDRQLHLARALEALDATFVVLLSVEKSGDVAILAAAGRLPSKRVMDEIRFVAFDRQKEAKPVLRQTGDGLLATWVDRGKNSVRALAVCLPRTRPKLEHWESDFFGFLAARFLELAGNISSDAATAVSRNLEPPPEMVLGESTAMRRLLGQIEATVSSRMEILLWGETGTGKELVARMIHDSGPTAAGPFVAINCAAIPGELLEAELFGVLGRVATDVDPRPGHFLAAEGGSIFLDEIAELPARLQAKLLRVLQEREVLQLGSSKPKKIDVRVIAATNQNIFELVEQKEFRRDLYYRLRGLQFHIPPLRERKEDIPPLVLSFLRQFSEQHDKRVEGISRKALDLLMEHVWPGNVRELRNEVERAVLICPDGSVLQNEHFGPVRWQVERRQPLAAAQGPLDLNIGPEEIQKPVSEEDLNLQMRVDAVERELILEALRRTGGNKSKAARLLGITRNGLTMKVKRLRL